MHIDEMRDGIMHKDGRNARITGREISRNRVILKVRDKVGQYFGLAVLHQGAPRVRVTTLAKGGGTGPVR